MTINCSKSIAKAIINAFRQGVVPSKGLGTVAVGRKGEIRSVAENIDDAIEGRGSFRIVSGRYGAGKSFMLALIREYAMNNKGMVVMSADLSESALFSGSKKGTNLYRSLIAGMSVSGKQGGAMELIIKRWLECVKKDIAKRTGIEPENVSPSQVVTEIRRLTFQMTERPLYSVFIEMVGRYYLESGSSEQKALMWLKGEYEQRSLAKQELGVGTIVDDSNWFDFIKIWSEFVRYAGYNGLVILFDEAVSVYKLANSRSREKNYEKILSIYNYVVQGDNVHMAIYMGCTPDMISHETRGIYSYKALYSRVTPGRFVNGRSNPRGVIMDLRALNREEAVTLLFKLTELHAIAYDYTPTITQSMIESYVNSCYAKMGVNDNLSPRQLSREFIPVLDTLLDDPDADFDTEVNVVVIRPDVSHDSDFYPPEKPVLEP